MTTNLTEAVAREIAMGRMANQPDRITAAKIDALYRAREKRS